MYDWLDFTASQLSSYFMPNMFLFDSFTNCEHSLVVFYGTSIVVGYLMLNPINTYMKYDFKEAGAPLFIHG